MPTILGTQNDDTINGTSKDDVIDGLAGKDFMAGGAGNDTYYVDNTLDFVSEFAGGGVDTIISTVSYKLATYVENLTLAGSGNINATGNDFANVIIGNDGNNGIAAGDGNNTVFGNGGNDNIIGGSGSDELHGGAGNDWIKGGSGGVDHLYGDAGDDTILGSNDRDVIDGGTGADFMQGQKGDDEYYIDNVGDKVVELSGLTEGNDTVYSTVSIAKLWDNIEVVHLQGNANINVTGNTSDSTLYGNDGNNVIDGGGGNDYMVGGKGHDTYYIDQIQDVAIEKAGEGTDTIISSQNWIQLGDNFENLTFTGNGNAEGIGNNLDNTITGNDGNNWLDGGQGKDTLIGGKGDDTYTIDSFDTIIESVSNADGGGYDSVRVMTTYTLGANLDELWLGGVGNFDGAGNELDNRIYGNDGNNTLDGMAGADILYGGDGNDTYIVDNINDQVWDNSGTDTVWSTTALTNGYAGIEKYFFDTTVDLNFTGDGGGDEIHGGSGNDTISSYSGATNLLYGNAGNDTLIGGDKHDVLDGGTGADVMKGDKGDDFYYVNNAGDQVVELNGTANGYDTVYSTVSIAKLWDNVETGILQGADNLNLTGNDAMNYLYGNAGNNVIDGGKGADWMLGGAGNDTYYVDNAGDMVSENAAAGIDTVISQINYTLGANVENLTLVGGNVNGTGNALDNTIWGNDGANIIDGGLGADIMNGGKGDDVYYVDNAKDQVIELLTAAQGGGTFDTIVSSVEYSLANLDNVENLMLTGNANGTHLTGNALDNILVGSSGNNILDGGLGGDLMSGGDGSDTYYVDNLKDQVWENTNQGIDTVYSSIALSQGFDNVENFTFNTSTDVHFLANNLSNLIQGGSGNDTLDGLDGYDTINGNGGNDTLIGGDKTDILNGGIGDDTLIGGAAGDFLTGGAGADTFSFDLAGAGSGNDKVTDLLKAEDILDFTHVGDVNKDGNINLSDLFASVSGVVDHGAGQAVDVTFTNGSTISFSGAGTGAVNSIDDLVSNAATQIHVH